MKRRARALVGVSLIGASAAGGLVLSAGASAAASGTVSIGSTAYPPSLDPTSNASAAIDEVFDYNVYQHLVQLDPKGAVVDVLATKVSQSTNGLSYTFKIRSGVKFTNGDPMTASDVVYSLDRADGAQTTGGPADVTKSTYPYAALLSGVKSVTSPSSSTVVVKLSAPNNQFLYNLASYSNGEVLDPSAVSTIATKPVGTGPYEFDSTVTNYSVTLGANPSYWGTAPKLATVMFRYYTSPTAENAALKSNQIQVIDNLSDTADVTQFTGSSQFKVIHGPTTGKIQMTINNSSGPLKNLKVRQAINDATDKAAILKTAGYGYGTVIGSDDVPVEPWYSPSLAKVYSYSPAKAKKLLKEAGYAKGFSLTLTIPSVYGYAVSAAPIIQANLDAIGIKTTIKDVAFPLWLSSVFEKSDFQLTIIDHVEARDIANYANCDYYWKYAGCKTVAKMLSKAETATTASKTNALFGAIAKYINADAVNDWLYNPDSVTVAAQDLVGVPSAFNGEAFDLQFLSVGGALTATAKSEGFAS
jgi:peptide/nickel transport system substrate-binding protein